MSWMERRWKTADDYRAMGMDLGRLGQPLDKDWAASASWQAKAYAEGWRAGHELWKIDQQRNETQPD